MGQMQNSVHSPEEVKSISRSIMKNAHDTQQGGVKQSITQDVKNSQIGGGEGFYQKKSK